VILERKPGGFAAWALVKCEAKGKMTQIVFKIALRSTRVKFNPANQERSAQAGVDDG
jgi:hypothetical protein